MTNYSITDFNSDIPMLADKIAHLDHSDIFGVPKGGVPLAMRLSDLSGLPITPEVTGPRTLIVDDIVDSGRTMARFPNNDFLSIYWSGRCDPPTFYLHCSGDEWIHFWWEGTDQTSSIEDAVMRLLQYIGEDVHREGLIDTPKRVIKSYSHLFSGYSQKPEDILTTFSADGYDEMVLLKDIELYSMCEHHMLPFIGKAHVAYIPDKKIIGISKLARLVEIYARRLQIQERIGAQITSAIMKYLQPKGAACIIEAQHLCMKMRGVEKQNSVMVTSSLTGIFLDKPSVREELLRLVRG